MAQSIFSVALAGNPNAGKTSLFNALTGARQRVGNYPGVTVDKKEGITFWKGLPINIVDLPGTYSLTAYSLDELVARNHLIEQQPDVVVDVLDASNLERNLYLAIQFMELGIPLVICLNMIDVANKRGVRIDTTKLARLLGVPVVTTVARNGQGIKELLSTIVKVIEQKKNWQPLIISYGTDLDQGLNNLINLLDSVKYQQERNFFSTRWLALKCLENDTDVLATLIKNNELKIKIQLVLDKVTSHIRITMDDEPENIIADYRYGFINSIVRQAMLSEDKVRLDFSDKIDEVLTNRLIGPLFLLSVLYGVYEFVFWVSRGPVISLEIFFSWLSAIAELILPEGLLRSLIVSGIIDSLGGVLGFVPVIMFMFFAISVMEDSGYMARMAYLMDRLLRIFGLHGNSVISLIIGGGISGGCAVPAIMATRTLKDPRARLATILVVPFMNCGAKLPAYSLLIGTFFITCQAEMMMALTLISWGLALLAALMLRSTILKGEQTPFVMELPPYRTPTIKGLLIHTWERTWQYIKKAGTVLLAASILMWAFMTFPGLTQERKETFTQRLEQAQTKEAKKKINYEQAKENLLATIAGSIGEAMVTATKFIGFDWQINVALLGGLAAKEVIVATLGTAYSLGGEFENKNNININEDSISNLSKKLKESENSYHPLRAFSLMIFVMIYSPCIATLVMMKRETGSWGWPIFSIIYNTILAYLITLLIYQGGQFFGLG